MKHVMVAEKSILLGDQTADLLVEYAMLVGRERWADQVDVNALGAEGQRTIVTFLLNEGLSMVSETTHSVLPEPDNRKADEYLHTQIDRLRTIRSDAPEDIVGSSVWNTDEM